MKRRLASRGLSYYDANRDRLVTIDNDCLSIKRRILERWPELKDVYWDKDQEEWIVTQITKEGIEEFVLATKTLNEEVIRRLEKADMYVAGQEDPLSLADAYNAELEREQDRQLSDTLGDIGERFAHALRQDGISHAPRVSFHIPNRA